MLSSLAFSIKPQVFTITMLWSFLPLSCTTSISLAINCPLSTSLSTIFLLQPSVIMFTLSLCIVFVFILLAAKVTGLGFTGFTNTDFIFFERRQQYYYQLWSGSPQYSAAAVNAVQLRKANFLRRLCGVLASIQRRFWAVGS